MRTPLRRDDGIIIRRATTADLDGIVALAEAELGSGQGRNVRTVLSPPYHDLDMTTVAVDGDRVVSMSLLLRHRLRVGEVELPAAQMEWVATAPAYRGRGLVRDQFDVLHHHAERDGALVEFLDGIPYFYRRLGYAHAIPRPPEYALPRQLDAGDAEVRAAVTEDAAAIATLVSEAAAAADVATVWTADHVRWALERPVDHEPTHVAVREGAVTGFARTTVFDGWARVAHVAGHDHDAIASVLSAAVASGSAPLAKVIARAHPLVGTVCAELGLPMAAHPGLYVRIPRPLALLRALRAELSRRLAASPWRDADGALTLSTYRAAYRLRYRTGAVTGVDEVDPLHEPLSSGGIGVPPDHLAGLVLGGRRPADLEAFVDDVLFGRHLDLVATLFPPLRHDYLPIAL